MALLFDGVVGGCAIAITAVGLVIVYRSLRIINFAQAALGAAGGRLFFEFIQFTQVPVPDRAAGIGRGGCAYRRGLRPDFRTTVLQLAAHRAHGRDDRRAAVPRVLRVVAGSRACRSSRGTLAH